MFNITKVNRGPQKFFGKLRTSAPIDKICQLYEKGMSENAIAKKLKIGRRVIRNRLLYAGIHIRSQSEAESLKWSQMSIAKRRRQVSAAHKAAKGRIVSFDEKYQRAFTNQQNLNHVSSNEILLSNLLELRKIKTIPQFAIGPYNCDLAANPVAVEVYSGHWHWYGRHLRRVEERFNYILNAGWFIYVVAISKSFPLTDDVVDYLASYIKSIRRNKPSRTEYRVVWGAGKYIASGSLNDNHISIIPPFTNTRDVTTGRYKSIPR